ncbi:MAG: hypothetical protein M3Q58_11210 [Bacteroidota bacterium]|nr:hypothetical protein [Bacteroidota bacterium]
MYQLTLSRLGFFIRRQAVMNVQSLWIALGAISGFLIVITVLVAYIAPYNLGSLKGLYITVFYFAGLIFTSRIFSELNKPQKSYNLLTLPVSNLEKIAGAWIVTSPVFTLIYLLFIFLIITISSFVAGHPIDAVHFFDQDTLRSIAVYMVIQPVFLLGACAFIGNNFLKTVFSIFLFSVIVAIFSSILVSIFFEGGNLNSSTMDPGFLTFIEDDFVPVISFLFWYILGPFMLVVSYFKLKERQI